MRYLLIVMGMLSCPLTSAVAQVNIGIGLPDVRIGIDLPVYPRLVRVPGYPVYYAPNVDSNYFFYDGMYWVYQGDNWYTSSWYNGPWAQVTPDLVPLYVLRVPVRYYTRPPAHFSAWRRNGPPRWGEHWGDGWQRQHSGWDRWNRRASPRPSPLPVYQRRYSGNRYPQAEERQALHRRSYRYQPRETTVQEAYRAQGLYGGPPPSQRGHMAEHPARSARQPPARATHGGAPEPDGNHGQPKGDERRREHGR